MALLERVDRVLKLMSLRDDEDVRDALIEAMTAATETIGDALRTPLERATVEDFYLVPASRQYGPNVQRRRDDRVSRRLAGHLIPTQTEFELSRGFVDEGAAAVTVVASGEVDAIKGGDSSLNIDLVAEDRVDVNVEAEIGRVRLSDFGLANTYVRIGYTAGLVTDLGEPAVYRSVPSWLRQAALLQCALNLVVNPTLNPFQGEQGPSMEQLKVVDRQLGQLIDNHARYFPMAQKPIFSNVTLL